MHAPVNFSPPISVCARASFIFLLYVYFQCEEDGVSVSTCAPAAQACMPAGVHAMYTHSPRELLTSPTAPFAQPPCLFLEDP